MFGDDVSPLRCRQNYLDKLPVFHLVIVAIKLKNVSFYLITYFTFLLFLMSLFFAAFYDVFLVVSGHMSMSPLFFVRYQTPVALWDSVVTYRCILWHRDITRT